MIWLLRHAEAEPGSPDADRPLTAAGEEDSRNVGAALAELGIELDACLTSPKVRAAETARLACEALGLEPVVEPRLGGGPFDPEELALGVGDRVLLVGHDPDFSAAIHRATGAQVRLPKGAVAAVDRGELMLLLRPKALAALARAR